MVVAAARVDEHAEALRLVARTGAADERSRRVQAALELIRRGDLDPGGILVVRDPRGAVCGALVCAPLAGGGGLVWPPQTTAASQRELIEDQLLQAALDWLRQRGVKLVQALLTPSERGARDALERNGLRHITALHYLSHDLELPTALLASREQLHYQPYRGGTRQLLHDTLLRTYEGTHDFPEVNGVRSIAEVIAGHQAQGLHDPQLWWLACLGDQPAGVLLLTVMPDGDGWDVIYVGVVPELRGRGLGRELVLKAIYEARLAEQRQLTLSVDARNAPARRLYAGVGFFDHEQREVYLRVWP